MCGTDMSSFIDQTTHRFEYNGLWNHFSGPGYSGKKALGDIPTGILLSDYHAYLVLSSDDMSGVKRGEKFPGDFTPFRTLFYEPRLRGLDIRSSAHDDA